LAHVSLVTKRDFFNELKDWDLKSINHLNL
jgi:hypothetical protein